MCIFVFGSVALVRFLVWVSVLRLWFFFVVLFVLLMVPVWVFFLFSLLYMRMVSGGLSGVPLVSFGGCVLGVWRFLWGCDGSLGMMVPPGVRWCVWGSLRVGCPGVMLSFPVASSQSLSSASACPG
ncbi:MAG: hypothetical protein IJ733_06765 [Lachnospiraceae bacterium]|nr:hypothetical protein [Lachnospiraceae bacterium]